MALKSAFDKLSSNPEDVVNETVRLLCKIADNIISDPTNFKFRNLRKNNSTIFKKILNVNGGQECLKLMGFKENSTSFTMTSEMQMSSIKDFRNALISWKSSYKTRSLSGDNLSSPIEGRSISNFGIKRIILPPMSHKFNNPFLRRIETYSNRVLQYENKDLQKRAKESLPLSLLEENAQRRLRLIQEMMKRDKLPDPDLSIQDTLLLELLAWFKNDFFEWVNSPNCEKCGNESQFSHMAIDKKYLLYTDRVELHKCKTCAHLTAFPRYEDLNILLETRKGRCGEWSDVFTLFCRSLGWDARLVVEEGDHVWTEVFSYAQKRWIHCDSCENAYDTPLIYETGWNKRISYIIAYSVEEVQDVTWRYSCNHKEVMKRRNECSEFELLDAIMKIREDKMKNLSQARKDYLAKRSLFELVEFLNERKPTEEEIKGRTSGSAAWRLARGEIQNSANSSFVWHINTNDLVDNCIHIRYFCALNKYESSSGGRKLKVLEKWEMGAYHHKGIFRKEEKDWRMVYLATNEFDDESTITWKFEWQDGSRNLDSIVIYFDYATFDSGEVTIKICSGDKCIVMPKDLKNARFDNFGLAKELTITASLRGGKSWQHAQLFRQSSESLDNSFDIELNFK